ncbi:MAG: hypothetical protein IJD96_06380, partial [Lachnospiraceae bacterium]|nr:hypothetical protein [Lachnospiraceae bacterium]
RRNEDFKERYQSIDNYLKQKDIFGAPEAYWYISDELAERDMEEHKRMVYTPENIAEFEREGEMMALERAIYGDER